MSLCPRGCGRPSRRTISRKSQLCWECHDSNRDRSAPLTGAWRHDRRGIYRKAQRSALAAQNANAIRQRERDRRTQIRFELALAALRRRRKVAA